MILSFYDSMIFMFRTRTWVPGPPPLGSWGTSQGVPGELNYPPFKVWTVTLLDFCIVGNHLKMCIWALRSAAELGKEALGFVLRFGITFLGLLGAS